jgi:prophage tail gpP-like protein
VTISLGGQQVINGKVTTRSGAYDKDSHQLVIAGRSNTSEMVDSSVKVQPGTFSGSTFEQAANAVMQPHGVGLVMMNPPDITSKPFQSLAVQYGESAAEFIECIAAMRGLFLGDDENGNLVAGQGDPSAATVAELTEGVNIKRCTFKIDAQNTWFETQGTSQQTGTDQSWPPRANSASAIDSSAPSNRYRLFIAEHPADSEELATRVNYDAARLAWQTVNVSVTVVGWFKPDGNLWKPAENVSIYSPMAFPNGTSAVPPGIQAVVWTQDDQNGTETTLELVIGQKLTTNPTAGIPDIPSSTGPAAANPDQPN